MSLEKFSISSVWTAKNVDLRVGGVTSCRLPELACCAATASRNWSNKGSWLARGERSGMLLLFKTCLAVPICGIVRGVLTQETTKRRKHVNTITHATFLMLGATSSQL
jgi:hypothetical protein